MPEDDRPMIFLKEVDGHSIGELTTVSPALAEEWIKSGIAREARKDEIETNKAFREEYEEEKIKKEKKREELRDKSTEQWILEIENDIELLTEENKYQDLEIILNKIYRLKAKPVIVEDLLDRISEKTGNRLRTLKKHFDIVSESLSKEKQEEEKEKPLMTEEERKKALDILCNGEPLNLILNSMSQLHVGDDAIKILFSLSPLTTRLRSGEIHIMLVGKSGGGKKIASKMLNCFPTRKYKSWASLSPQAIKYYYAINPGCLLHHIDESKVIGEGVGLLRALTSGSDFGGVPSSHGTVKDGEFLGIEIEESIVVWLCCVKPVEDEENQLPNRFFIPNIDESKKQDLRVREFQKIHEGEGDECDIDEGKFKDIQNMMYILLEKEDRVCIPFIDAIEYKHEEDRRLYLKFCTLIKACAKLHKFQRQKGRDKKGREVIVASYFDFLVAQKVWDSFRETHEMKINRSALRVYRKVSLEDMKTRRELADRLKMPYTTIANVLHKQLIPQGLVDGWKENKNTWVYKRSIKDLQDLQDVTITLNVSKISSKGLNKIELQHLQGRGGVLNISFDMDEYLKDFFNIPYSVVNVVTQDEPIPSVDKTLQNGDCKGFVAFVSDEAIRKFLKNRITLGELDFSQFDNPSAAIKQLEDEGYIEADGSIWKVKQKDGL